MTIILCDDDPVFLNTLLKNVQQYTELRSLSATITATTNPIEDLENSYTCDIAILDIQMAGCNGITLARELKHRNPSMALIFSTGYMQYLDSAMDLDALRYLHKPFDTERLFASLDKAIEYINTSCLYIYFKESNFITRIIVDDILYVTRSNRHTLIHTASADYTTTEEFNSIIAKLPVSFFFLVHKSFFVNLHHICRYSYSSICLADNSLLSVAPRKQAAFRNYWFDYLRRR